MMKNPALVDCLSSIHYCSQWEITSNEKHAINKGTENTLIFIQISCLSEMDAKGCRNNKSPQKMLLTSANKQLNKTIVVVTDEN